MGRKEPELAYRGSIFRTAPSAQATIAVTTSSATEVDALAPYRGRWVWLRALGGDITYLRGTHTLTAGVGMVIEDGKYEEHYVSPDDDHDLSHIGSAAATLVILFDTEDN